MAKLRPGPCSKPWSTGRMIILPVPPSRPCIRMRARLALVPGLSDSYLSRIVLTAGVMLIAREAPLWPIRFGSASRYPTGARRTNRGRPREAAAWLSKSLPLAFTTSPGKWGNIVMIALVALLNVAQPLPWLDRNWINHMAHREMLVAASATHFGAPPRLPIQL